MWPNFVLSLYLKILKSILKNGVFDYEKNWKSVIGENCENHEMENVQTTGPLENPVICQSCDKTGFTTEPSTCMDKNNKSWIFANTFGHCVLKCRQSKACDIVNFFEDGQIKKCYLNGQNTGTFSCKKTGDTIGRNCHKVPECVEYGM